MTSQISICKLLINEKCNVCVGLSIKPRIKNKNHIIKKHSTTSSHRVCLPGTPLVSPLQAPVLPREVFPAPCTGQHDTSQVCRGWLWKQESRCFLQTMHVQQVSKVVQALFEKPPSWIVGQRVQSLAGIYQSLGSPRDRGTHQRCSREDSHDASISVSISTSKPQFYLPVTERITDNHKGSPTDHSCGLHPEFLYQDNRIDL